ncbi:MAG: hypothetical protein IID49_11655 [Proteobacteria bacterium]|nr:hypothetical protein [Pseudomonadota bacterium]
MRRPGQRRSWLLAGALAAMVLSGCETPGVDARDAELTRQRAESGFAVIEASAGRAVFIARGQRVVVEPPEGYCLDEGSIAVTKHAAFALIAECMRDHRAEVENGAVAGRAVEIALPRAFPGILTVSVSGEPAYGWETGALDAFEDLLGTPAGLKLLGRGNSAAPGAITATRRIGGAIYVLIEEPAGDAASILAPRFWRAFININGRLVLTTVSSFSDRPMAEDAMMGFLAQQMTRLRQANGLRVNLEEDEIARQMAASLASEEGQGGLTVVRAARPAAVPDQADPVRAPMPRQRVASAGFVPPEPDPIAAPYAPRRPG